MWQEGGIGEGVPGGSDCMCLGLEAREHGSASCWKASPVRRDTVGQRQCAVQHPERPGGSCEKVRAPS